MATLDWIGKKAVVNHHREVPYHLLKEVPELSCGDADSGNLIVEGDNLVALKALLPYYAGKVKCIYIDPPYNTGMDRRDGSGTRTGWIYSDNVNSAEIRTWLGKTVGEEAEDLSRHDKWLCMMYPRISLLKEFLKEDGVIFISIDDNELSSLQFLFDEIFGARNHVGTIIWKNATDNNPTQIASEHEYILCYAKAKSKLPKQWKSTTLAVKERLLKIGESFVEKFEDEEELQKEYSKWFRENKAYLWPFQDYKFIDCGGVYTGLRGVHNPGKEGYRYDIIHPETGKPCKEPMMGYRFPEETYLRLLEEGRIIFGDDETKIIELKVYVKDYRAKLSSLFELDGRIGTNEIKAIFPDNKRPFDFPKPTELIQELLSFVTSEEDIVLDSFAGSGTTGQAILELNKMDSERRRFILVEMDSNIARNITQRRMDRVIQGYGSKRADRVEGLGGSFQYASLGEPLHTSEGRINEAVKYPDLARHVFFIETGEPLPNDRPLKDPLLGISNGKAVYLLYNGILKDKSVGGGNRLTRKVLMSLPEHDGPKVVYGTACQLGPELIKRHNLTFKQIPYSIRTS